MVIGAANYLHENMPTFELLQPPATATNGADRTNQNARDQQNNSGTNTLEHNDPQFAVCLRIYHQILDKLLCKGPKIYSFCRVSEHFEN